MKIEIQHQQGDFRLDVAINGAERGITALYGPSGAGKSSIIQVVAGLRRPQVGYIRLKGRCLFCSQQKINLAPEKRRVGYVFQDSRLLPHISVKSNLHYGRKLVPVNEQFIDYDRVIDLLGIGHLLRRRPCELSGGEKQRVAIGRALLMSPDVLLMDEPLNSLDSLRKQELLPFIREVSDVFEIPILYVSHSQDEIRQLADTVVMIEQGRVLSVGPSTF
jgi:molybdate transport system ATP-binding protein